MADLSVVVVRILSAMVKLVGMHCFGTPGDVGTSFLLTTPRSEFRQETSRSKQGRVASILAQKMHSNYIFLQRFCIVPVYECKTWFRAKSTWFLLLGVFGMTHTRIFDALHAFLI